MDTNLLIALAISLVWLTCLVVCFLKGKYGMAIVALVAAVAQQIGLPPIGGYYVLNLSIRSGYCPFLEPCDLRIRNLITPIDFIGTIFTSTGARSRDSD